jgi:hypothetical protein
MPLTPATVGRVLAGLVVVALAPALEGGDKGLDATGQVKVGEHKPKLQAGALYRIEAEGKGFRPKVIVATNPRYYEEDFGKENAYRCYTVVNKTHDYRVLVLPDALDPIGDGKLEYTVKFTPVPLEAKPILQVTDKWTEKDPPYPAQENAHHKVYPLKLKGGQFYIIDLVKKSAVDPYLYLENEKKEVVTSDDDSGGDLNARIVFRPAKDGEYRIIATTLTRAVGGFELTVRTEQK